MKVLLAAIVGATVGYLTGRYVRFGKEDFDAQG